MSRKKDWEEQLDPAFVFSMVNRASVALPSLFHWAKFIPMHVHWFKPEINLARNFF